MLRRLAALVLLALATTTAAACGVEDGAVLGERLETEVEERRARIEARIAEARAQARAQAREISREVRRRVEETLGELTPAVPRAQTNEAPRIEGDPEAQTIDQFLTRVIGDVDRYWERTFEANDIPGPRVSYAWIPPGQRVRTACGEPADERSAFYCPVDDTIYVGQVLAAEVYQGIARGFPGEAAGQGRAIGDFGVAYLVAHEYAHNVQQELGFFSRRRQGASARPFELQADCLAGTWGASVYREGRIKPGDVEEALGTALAVGDFEVGSVQHHGTPEERREAWLLGFESGDPSACSAYVGA